MAIRKLDLPEKNCGVKLFDKFKENAELIGAKVFKVKGQVDATKKITELLSELKAKKVIIAPEALHNKLQLKKDLTTINFLTNNLLKDGLDAEVGICEAHFAVVETGSIGLDCSDFDVRLASAIPPIHIALVSAETILDRFVESFKIVSKSYDGHVSYFNYISGPSRTADIERVLTIGVHGPEQLYILVIE